MSDCATIFFCSVSDTPIMAAKGSRTSFSVGGTKKGGSSFTIYAGR